MLFVETSTFSALLPRYFSDDEFRELQIMLMERPDTGDVIPGSGGIRKVRWARPGMGKSGGMRVIYYWAKAPEHIYLLTMYAKGERENIDAATLKRIAKQLESIK